MIYVRNKVAWLVVVASVIAAALAYELPGGVGAQTAGTFTADNIIANTSIQDKGLTATKIVATDGSKNLASLSDVTCSGSGSAITAITGTGFTCGAVASATTSGGLYNGTMTTIPTQTGLGFSNWNVPAGAAFVDTDQGVELTWATGASPSMMGITAVAPATPYTVTATLAYSYTCGANTGNQGCVGWAQGTSGTTGSTKAEVLCYVPCGAGGFQQRILDATSSTGGSFLVSQSAAYIRSSGGGLPWFVRLKDDGTTVTFSISFDGIGFTTVYSVAKASGFLGAGGYSRLFFGTWDFANGPAYDALLGWKITSP